jgi:hypothetical protein
MLYKHGGPHEIHGDNFDYIIVDEKDVDAKVKEGWAKTTDEAKAPKAEKKPAAKRAAKAKTEE